MNDRYSLEVQIMEFGQVPRQIFTVPHPQRISATSFLKHAKLLSNHTDSYQNKGIQGFQNIQEV